MTEKNEKENFAEDNVVNSDKQDVMEGKKKTKANDILMASDIVDQINYNQQSNMSLSAYSVITQSYSTVKINISDNDEWED